MDVLDGSAAGPMVPRAQRTILAALLLGAVVLVVYAQVRNHDFVTLDDPYYITDHPRIARGLSWDNVIWSFGHAHAGNWHPVTTMSHMIDRDLFGDWAGGHHLMSATIHALDAVLLFLALRLMTGAFWRPLLVAALFALHPLRVESVAWASERKDVLAGFFWMLTLIAYARYAGRPDRIRYVGVAVCLVLGLMSKPTVVTLPFVLMLMDVWPLRRLVPGSRTTWGRLAVEKLPLLGLSAAAAVVTVLVQRGEGAVRSIESLPLSERVVNGLTACVAYLGKTVWPSNLAVFYPHPAYVRDDALSSMIGTGAVAAIVLAALTFVVARFGRSRVYLGVGWLWYLVTLLPVIGLVQVGDQGMADRYTYLPQIGILIAVVWGGSELAGRSRLSRRIAGLVAVSAVVGSTAVTWIQIGHWKTSEALYEHAIRVTSGNYRVHAMLGQLLMERGDLHAAESQFREVLAVRPDKADAHVSLGVIAERRGEPALAESHYRKALTIAPELVDAHNNLGVLCARAARYDEAAEHLERALALEPDSFEAHVNVGMVYLNLRRPDRALPHLIRATELRPDHAAANRYLAAARAMLGAIRAREP